MERYFPPLSVITALALDVGFNSLAEPLHAHISIVILITCLQVATVWGCGNASSVSIYLVSSLW